MKNIATIEFIYESIVSIFDVSTMKVHIKSVWEKNEESLLVISYFPHFG